MALALWDSLDGSESLIAIGFMLIVVEGGFGGVEVELDGPSVPESVSDI